MLQQKIHQAYVIETLDRPRSLADPAALGIAGPHGPHCRGVLRVPDSCWRDVGAFWRTQLVELILNTVFLLAGVGCGTWWWGADWRGSWCIIASRPRFL